jgi:hypothetical protein
MVDPTSNLMRGVRRSVKDVKFKFPRARGKDKSKEEGKTKAPKKESKKNESDKKETSSSGKGKAYQPMLPGMKGAVKRVPASPKPKEEAPAKKAGPRAYQPMLPGMAKPRKQSAASPKTKKVKEDRFIPGGIDWASMPPVNLEGKTKGRQFNG